MRRDVRFVPKADILRCGKERRYSITSSARPGNGNSTLTVLRLMYNSTFVGLRPLFAFLLVMAGATDLYAIGSTMGQV